MKRYNTARGIAVDDGAWCLFEDVEQERADRDKGVISKTYTVRLVAQGQGIITLLPCTIDYQEAAMVMRDNKHPTYDTVIVEVTERSITTMKACASPTGAAMREFIQSIKKKL